MSLSYLVQSVDVLQLGLSPHLQLLLESLIESFDLEIQLILVVVILGPSDLLFQGENLLI